MKLTASKTKQTLSSNIAEEKMYRIYSLRNYYVSKEFIEDGYAMFHLSVLEKELLNNKGYHFRIKEEGQYIFFGDLDGYNNHFGSFRVILHDFMKQYYSIEIKLDQISHTENESKKGSFHYSIPSLHCSCKKLKEIHLNLLNTYPNIFIRKDDQSKEHRIVDTSIYSNHWFRAPNQSKSGKKDVRHLIQKGNIRDFIVEHIPSDSTSIENIVFNKNSCNLSEKRPNAIIKSMQESMFVDDLNELDNQQSSSIVKPICKSMFIDDPEESNIVHSKKQTHDTQNNNLIGPALNRMIRSSCKDIFDDPDKLKQKEKHTGKIDNANNENSNSKHNIAQLISFNNKESNEALVEIKNQTVDNCNYSKTFELYKNLFDRCFKQYRFDDYQDWTRVGMAIKNVYSLMGFPLFNYFSSKGANYEGTDKTLKKYMTFRDNMEKGYTMLTIKSMAKEDNNDEYQKIVFNEQSVSNLDDVGFAMKIKELAGHCFISKRCDNQYIIYSYNGQYWEASEGPLYVFISNKLYDYYVEHLKRAIGVIAAKKLFSKLKKMRNYSTMTPIIKYYKIIGTNNSIEFDNKYWLMGFDNLVYDLQLGDFRPYKIDDYISITTGYDWQDPTVEEINLVRELITKIMPIEEEKKLYYQILATTLEGKCLEKFIVFNGSGGNGKGMIDDMLLIALGNYGIVGTNSILFEKNKTGANPEKANLMKKRLIIFREPPEKNRFENSVVKELTGGGTLSARGLFESNTQQKLHGTIIVECNKKPLFAEEPTEAEARRLIDLLFRARFTDKVDFIDPEKFIYPANPKLKEDQFQAQHKYALLQILFDEYKEYKSNGYKFDIPKSTEIRTNEYLQSSCDILSWFRENYEYTRNEDNFVEIKDVINKFIGSEYYSNLTGKEKNKIKYGTFVEYFKTNPFLGQYYSPRYKRRYNSMIGWRSISSSTSQFQDDDDCDD